MSLAKQISKFRNLPHKEQMFLIAAICWLPVGWAALQVCELAAVQRGIRSKAKNVIAVPTSEDIQRLGALVNLAARIAPAPSTCLSRSLVLLWLLKRRGVEGQLRFGVRKRGEQLEAHAWVEYDGVPINDRRDIGDHFAAFPDSLPLTAFSLR